MNIILQNDPKSIIMPQLIKQDLHNQTLITERGEYYYYYNISNEYKYLINFY